MGKGVPKWRDFERLVAHIESTLVPQGALVTSPDKVMDLQTGIMREVDASIRIDVGSTPILITIECRDRSEAQDVTWIEELATKKDSIGAAKTIAVSRAGFSEAASKLAGLKGIDLRTFEDRIGEEIVQQFLSGFRVSVIAVEQSGASLYFELEDGVPLAPSEIGEDLRLALQENAHGPIVQEVATGAWITVDRLLRELENHCPEDGTLKRVGVVATFPPQAYLVSTTTGPRFVSKVRLEANLKRSIVPVPPKSLYEYRAGERTLRRTLDFAGPVFTNGDGVRILLDLDSARLDRKKDPPSE